VALEHCDDHRRHHTIRLGKSPDFEGCCVKALGLNLLIATVVMVACFALGGDLRHATGDTIGAMIVLSLAAGGGMWLRDAERDWMLRLVKPKPGEEDQDQ
jgi:hypothetical protein